MVRLVDSMNIWVQTDPIVLVCVSCDLVTLSYIKNAYEILSVVLKLVSTFK